MNLNLKINIDDNDIFGEEILDALKAEARRLTREQINISKQEVEKEVNRLAENWMGNYIRSTTTAILKEKCNLILRNTNITKEDVLEVLGRFMTDKELKKVLNEMVDGTIKKKFKTLLKEDDS